MGKVFISYSRQDSDFADKLTKSLEEKGVPVWVDRSEIKGGSDWRKDISDAIHDCSAFLLILSSRSTVSSNVDDELSLATEKGRRVFPILYETCELPAGIDLVLSRKQKIIFAGVPFENGLQQVLDALGHKIENVQPTSPPQDQPPPQNQPPHLRISRHVGMGGQVGDPPPVQYPPVSQVPPPPQEPPPLYQVICGRWNVVSAFARMYLEIYPNGAARGQFMTAYATSNVNTSWQIMPNGMLSLQGQMMTGWQAGPFMLNVTFNQVTPQFLGGVCLDGTLVSWYRVG